MGGGLSYDSIDRHRDRGQCLLVVPRSAKQHAPIVTGGHGSPMGPGAVGEHGRTMLRKREFYRIPPHRP